MAQKPDIALLFQHEQTTPSTSWVIVHNLNRYPAVDVYTMVEGALIRILAEDVLYTDDNTCTINFSTARTGFATVA